MKVVAKLRQRGEKDQPPKLLCYIKWLKNVVSLFFFFLVVLKMPKIWVGRTTRNGEKKGDGLTCVKTRELDRVKLHSVSKTLLNKCPTRVQHQTLY